MPSGPAIDGADIFLAAHKLLGVYGKTGLRAYARLDSSRGDSVGSGSLEPGVLWFRDGCVVWQVEGEEDAMFPAPPSAWFPGGNRPEKYFENHAPDGVRNLPPRASKSSVFDEKLVSSATPRKTNSIGTTRSIGEFRF